MSQTELLMKIYMLLSAAYDHDDYGVEVFRAVDDDVMPLLREEIPEVIRNEIDEEVRLT